MSPCIDTRFSLILLVNQSREEVKNMKEIKCNERDTRSIIIERQESISEKHFFMTQRRNANKLQTIDDLYTNL